MSISPNQLSIIVDDTNGRIAISGISLDLYNVVAKDRKTKVQADTVVVRGNVQTGGQDLTIICRNLLFEDKSIIDLSGSYGVPSFAAGLAAVGSTGAGADGADGQNGGDGNPSGALLIIAESISGNIQVSANGGKGGRAQDGGDGRKGIDGAPGQNGVEAKGQNLAICNGGPGGTGGAVGLPGFPGKGGDGGRVEIRSITQLVEGADRFVNVSGGISGDTAIAGRPGPGGEPGPAGSYWYWTN